MAHKTKAGAPRTVGVVALSVIVGASTLALGLSNQTPARAEGGRSAADKSGSVEGTWNHIPLRSTAVLGPDLAATLPISGIPSEDGGLAGVCPQEVVTHTNFTWQPGASFVAQAGFVADEIAAAQFVLPASEFPIRIDLMEGFFGTPSPSGQITTEWSVLVWQGPPNTGTLIAEYSSDGVILQPMVLNPPANAIHVQVSVDPKDPDQIIIADNPTHSFTLGFRIDEMNNPPTSSCNGGFTPPPCCPHNPPTNIFPTTDIGGVSQPTKNWLKAKPGCGLGSLSGWYTFQQLAGLGASPSGDWIIRATYSPTDCVLPTGSCCLTSGNCVDATSGECASLQGTYFGDGTSCALDPCPQSVGACCVNGNCIGELTPQECATADGTFLGLNTLCTANSCKGACCIPATQGCVNFTETNCASAQGIFQGVGTTCATTVCFPIGACCLPNGSCIGNQSPEQCEAAGGVFQGHQTTCGTVSCPIPEGACCLGSGACLSAVTEEDCGAVLGSWKGAASTCVDADASGTADVCETACVADVMPGGGNGIVDIDDLFGIIGAWSTADPQFDISPPGGNNIVDIDDLFEVIGGWGPCS